MNYKIIPMTTDHIDQVAELERRCFSDPWSRRMLSEHLENECAATLVAQGEEGTVRGYAGLLVVLDEGYVTLCAAGCVHPLCGGEQAGLPDAGGARRQRRRPCALRKTRLRRSGPPQELL